MPNFEPTNRQITPVQGVILYPQDATEMTRDNHFEMVTKIPMAYTEIVVLHNPFTQKARRVVWVDECDEWKYCLDAIPVSQVVTNLEQLHQDTLALYADMPTELTHPSAVDALRLLREVVPASQFLSLIGIARRIHDDPPETLKGGWHEQVENERERQRINWGDAHDDCHTDRQWVEYINERWARFAQDGLTITEQRRLTVECAAMLKAAWEVINRRVKRDSKTRGQ